MSAIVPTEIISPAFLGMDQVFQMILGSNPYKEHYYAYYDNPNSTLYFEDKNGQFYKTANYKLKLKDVFEFFNIERQVVGVEFTDPNDVREFNNDVDALDQEVVKYTTSVIILK